MWLEPSFLLFSILLDFSDSSFAVIFSFAWVFPLLFCLFQPSLSTLLSLFLLFVLTLSKHSSLPRSIVRVCPPCHWNQPTGLLSFASPPSPLYFAATFARWSPRSPPDFSLSPLLLPATVFRILQNTTLSSIPSLFRLQLRRQDQVNPYYSRPLPILPSPTILPACDRLKSSRLEIVVSTLG